MSSEQVRRTVPCWYEIKCKGCKKPNCTFAHNQSELSACVNHRPESGRTCWNDECVFFHPGSDDIDEYWGILIEALEDPKKKFKQNKLDVVDNKKTILEETENDKEGTDDDKNETDVIATLKSTLTVLDASSDNFPPLPRRTSEPWSRKTSDITSRKTSQETRIESNLKRIVSFSSLIPESNMSAKELEIKLSVLPDNLVPALPDIDADPAKDLNDLLAEKIRCITVKNLEKSKMKRVLEFCLKNDIPIEVAF